MRRAPLLSRPASTPIAFVVAAAGLAVTTLVQAPKPFVYDALEYWTAGETFTVHGHFSLANFDDAARGYLLPLIFRGLHELARLLSVRDATVAKLFNVVVFATIATVLLPALAQAAWPERTWGAGRRLLVAVLLAVLWGGFLAFPLSDFPAMAAALGALVAAARCERIGWMLVAGLCAGAAIDARPAYVVLPVSIAVIVVVSWWRAEAGWRTLLVRRTGCVVAALLGFALISLPQSVATHHHGGGWSFVPGSQAKLSSIQYTDGLLLQRYDTYVGTGHPPKMNYIDPAGSRLLGKRASVGSAGAYLRIVLHHPLTMLGVFGRHVINGLDQRYNTPYVERVTPSWLLRRLEFALAFLALLRLAWPAARRSLGETRWRYPLALALAGAPVVATAVETRFMLPIVLLSYVLVLAPGWPAALSTVGRTRRGLIATAAIVLAAAAFALLVHHVTTGATDHLRFG